MVLNWFFDRIFSEKRLDSLSKKMLNEQRLKAIFLDMLNDEEAQAFIVGFTDSLYERYKVKVLGTIGGLQKGINYAQDREFPSILDSKGRISLKNALPFFMNMMTQKGEQKTGGIP